MQMAKWENVMDVIANPNIREKPLKQRATVWINARR